MPQMDLTEFCYGLLGAIIGFFGILIYLNSGILEFFYSRRRMAARRRLYIIKFKKVYSSAVISITDKCVWVSKLIKKQ